jgi:hypothetical protein
MLSLWEELLILRAKWEERIDNTNPLEVGQAWRKAHDELDVLIKNHTRVKAPFDSQPR